MEGYRCGAAVRHKGEIDLVTEYDLRAEDFIREQLGKLFPQHVVVGEERSGDEERCEEGWVWFVDPIDGTTNFAHGHPFFCVSLALYRVGSSRGEPANIEPHVGVIEAPALGVTWHAARGQGAFRNEQRCAVSDCQELRSALCATGFPYDRWTNPDNNVSRLQSFLMRAQGIRRCGSAALDLALVADGTYDIYWERRLQPWDIGAGALLVMEAGGRVSTFAGEPFDPRSGELLATNGAVHDAARAVLAE